MNLEESYFGPFLPLMQQYSLNRISPSGAFNSLYPFVPGNAINRGRGEVIPAYLNDQGLQFLRDVSREMCLKNEYAVGVLENRQSFIVGSGFKYRVASVVPDGAPWVTSAQAAIDSFIAQTLWNEAEQEMVKRGDRDGETILRFYPCPNGDLDFRFVEPEHVRTPPEYAGLREFQLGVQTPPNDIGGSPISYSIVTDYDSWEMEFVDARDILHIKCNVDRNAKRGLPFLFSVGENLERAEKTLRNFATMAQLVATYSVLRRHKAPPSAVAAFRDQLQTLQATDPITGSQFNMEQMFPGGIVDVPQSTEYEFPGSSVNVGGHVQTLQAELRAIGARAVMPEYMVSGDASNANFASTTIAETPSNRMFDRAQTFYSSRTASGTGRYLAVMPRVLLAKARAGLFPPNILKLVKVIATPPNLAVRDLDKETNRNKILSDAGIITKQAWAQRENIDPNDMPNVSSVA